MLLLRSFFYFLSTLQLLACCCKYVLQLRFCWFTGIPSSLPLSLACCLRVSSSAPLAPFFRLLEFTSICVVLCAVIVAGGSFVF